jgi:hypothetical protein
MPQARGSGKSPSSSAKAKPAGSPAKRPAASAAAKPAVAGTATGATQATRAKASKPATAKPSARASAAKATGQAGTAKANGEARSAKATGQSTTSTHVPDPRLEAAAQRLRKLNERIIEAGKDAGETTLTSYEKALKAIAATIERRADSTEIDWISNLATTQAKFIRDVTDAWTKAAREMLKK